MNTPEIQMPGAGRRRGRYSDEFKRQVVGACLEPGVSTAAVALANRLNANLLRRWVVESSRPGKSDPPLQPCALAPARNNPAFIPVGLDPLRAGAQTDIRIELQHGATTARVHWPLGASSQCAAWVREVLK